METIIDMVDSCLDKHGLADEMLYNFRYDSSVWRNIEVTAGIEEGYASWVHIKLYSYYEYGYCILRQSNESAVIEELKEIDSEEISVRICPHEIFVRPYDTDGEFTAVYDSLYSLIEALRDYPTLDERDLRDREYEATIDSYVNESSYSIDHDIAGEIHNWFSDNGRHDCIDPVGGGGGWADRGDIDTALAHLGIAIRCDYCNEYIDHEDTCFCDDTVASDIEAVIFFDYVENHDNYDIDGVLENEVDKEDRDDKRFEYNLGKLLSNHYELTRHRRPFRFDFLASLKDNFVYDNGIITTLSPK